MQAVNLHEIEIDPRIETDRNGCRVTWSPDFQAFLAVRLTPEELQGVAECYLGQLLRGFFVAAARADQLAQRSAIFDNAPPRFASARQRVRG